MGQATGDRGGLEFLSTHPAGPERIRELSATSRAWKASTRPHGAGRQPPSGGGFLLWLIAHHGFHFKVLLEAMLAPFPARARLLVATERRAEVRPPAPLRWTMPVRRRDATRRARSRLPDCT